MPKISSLGHDKTFSKVWTLQEASFNGRVPMPYLYRLCQLGKIVARKDASGRWEISQGEFQEWLVGYRYRCRQPNPANAAIGSSAEAAQQ
jgi:hypothetical protein